MLPASAEKSNVLGSLREIQVNVDYIKRDTSVGIPRGAQSKIFTPLFTTTVVKRMTEGLGDDVTFESEIGKDTTFILRFPPPKQ